MTTENKKFLSGDRVISVRDTSDVPEGFIGIVEHTTGMFDYEVTDSKGRMELFNEDELELLSVGQSTVRLEGGVHNVEIKATLDPEYTGGSSNYYKVFVQSPTTLDTPYEAECNDIIEALKMTFAEGNAFKAIWRKAKARQGVQKKGYDNGLYDSEKVVFFGERMVVEAKSETN